MKGRKKLSILLLIVAIPALVLAGLGCEPKEDPKMEVTVVSGK